MNMVIEINFVIRSIFEEYKYHIWILYIYNVTKSRKLVTIMNEIGHNYHHSNTTLLSFCSWHNERNIMHQYSEYCNIITIRHKRRWGSVNMQKCRWRSWPITTIANISHFLCRYVSGLPISPFKRRIGWFEELHWMSFSYKVCHPVN